MKPRMWGLIVGLLVIGAVIYFYGPSECVALAEADHAIDAYQSCETFSGRQVEIPPRDTTSFTRGPTSPNWVPVIMQSFGAGLLAGTVAYGAAQVMVHRRGRTMTADSA